MGHVYEVKIDNGLGTFVKKWHSTLVLNMEHGPNAWPFEIYFPGNPTGIEHEREVKIYRDSQLYWRGMIKSWKPEYTKTGKMMVARGVDIVSDNANDGLEELIDEYTDEPRDLIRLACDAAGISYGVQDLYGSDIVFTKDWPKSIDTFSRICGMIGWQSRVNPINNSLDFQAQVGQDRTASIHFEESETCTVMSVERSSSRLFNRIYGKGKDGLILDVSGHPYVEDVASQTTYGIKPFVLVERDITDHDTLQLRCQSFLDKHEEISITYKIVIKEPWQGDLFNHYNIGDLVKFTAASVGVAAYVEKRIVKMKITHDTNHGEVITMELGDKSLSFFQLHEKYKGYVESLITTDPVDPETVLNLEETATNQNEVATNIGTAATNIATAATNIGTTATNQSQTQTESPQTTTEGSKTPTIYGQVSTENYRGPTKAYNAGYGTGISSLEVYAPYAVGTGIFLVVEAKFTNSSDVDTTWIIADETEYANYMVIHSKLVAAHQGHLAFSFVMNGNRAGHKIVASCQAGTIDRIDLKLWIYGEHQHTHVSHTHTQQLHTHVHNSHSHTQQSHNHTQNSHGHNQNSHNHNQNSHNHTQDSHSHMQNVHNHLQEEHDHVV